MSFRQVLSRVWRHLSRKKTLHGWIIVFASLSLYELIHIELLRQVIFVLIGVILAYIFLPDPAADINHAVAEAVTESSLWLDDARRMRGTVGAERLVQAAREVLTAVDPDRGPLAWKFGCEPLLSCDPGSIWEQFRYTVHLKRTQLAHQPFYRVATTLSAKRTIAANQVWTSFANTPQALDREYYELGCLGRELVQLPRDVWAELIAAGTGDLQSTLTVGSTPFPGRPTLAEDLLRYEFDYRPATAVQEQMTLSSHFLLPPNTRTFPVEMATYYCRGRAVIDFEVEDEALQNVDVFALFAGSFEFVHQKKVRSLDIKSRWTVETPDDALLSPGSGVVFVWECRP